MYSNFLVERECSGFNKSSGPNSNTKEVQIEIQVIHILVKSRTLSSLQNLRFFYNM